jgi:hypothetical protein
MAKFKPGQRVILPADESEGWKREAGKVIECTRMTVLVQLDRRYYEPLYDDGLRELDPCDARADRSKKRRKS